MKRFILSLLVCLSAGVLSSQNAPSEYVGRLGDGSFMLPTGWRISPAGTPVPLDAFPMSSALSPDGRFLLVLNAGGSSVSVLTTAPVKELARVPAAGAWLGLTFSPNGKFVYVGGGAQDRVHEFSFSDAGEMRLAREFEIVPAAQRTADDFIGDVQVSPDGRLIYAAELYRNTIAVINPQSGRVIEHFKTAQRPYRILFHPDGKSFFVSSWARDRDGGVYQHDTNSGAVLNTVRLGPHLTDMVLSNRKPDAQGPPPPPLRLFVAAPNSNTVYSVGITDSKDMRMLEPINIASTPLHALGMTPSAVALSPDQTKLFVTCSDANVVAVADITEDRTFIAGYVPTGWYPTVTRALPDGRLIVLNGKGEVASQRIGDAPPAGPIASLSVIDPLNEESIEQYTTATEGLNPYRDTDLEVRYLTGESVLYSKPDKPSPIEHVIYIVKEGRSYDSVFGKIGKGNSDPSRAVYDETIAPNHIKLGREFVLFDNFYANGERSIDGTQWATAAIATDYTQKLSAKRANVLEFEGGEIPSAPPAGNLWNSALSAGLSFRNYGFGVVNKTAGLPDGTRIDKYLDPALQPVTNARYRSVDPAYPDSERAKVFLDDLKQFETSGNMPRLMMLRLAGYKARDPYVVANNDAALGAIVEAVSKSQFWSKTAIFVVEAWAEPGSDHLDSHRAVMFALSPYTHRGIVDSTMYNQTSVLRTIELILGLRPMTQFDAASTPLAAAFDAKPNVAPYTAPKSPALATPPPIPRAE